MLAWINQNKNAVNVGAVIMFPYDSNIDPIYPPKVSTIKRNKKLKTRQPTEEREVKYIHMYAVIKLQITTTTKNSQTDPVEIIDIGTKIKIKPEVETGLIVSINSVDLDFDCFKY